MLYFRYKPLNYFIESTNYEIGWSRPDKKQTWNTLNYFFISQLGERKFEITNDDIHTEIKFDIVEDENRLHQGFYKDGKFGQEIVEYNGEIHFYEIYNDMIRVLYTKEEYPEYYL